MLQIFVYGLLGLTLLSCDNGDQKSYSQLGELRILAVTADAPEINIPQTVNISPYLSYPDGGDTTLNVTFEACPDPGISFGAEANCDGFPDTLVQRGTATFATSGLGANTAYTGPGPNLAIVVPASAFAALQEAGSNLQFNGIDYLVFMDIQDANNPNQNIKAVKRIVLSTKTTGLNTNPTVSGVITGDNQALSAFPTGEVDLTLPGTSAPESYQFRTTDGAEITLDELMAIAWFSNAGSFQFTRVAPDKPNTFDPETDTSGTFVGVYRDNRGGVTVVQVNL